MITDEEALEYIKGLYEESDMSRKYTLGARWGSLINNLPDGWTRDEWEEKVSEMLDNGLIYEPCLGILRVI